MDANEGQTPGITSSADARPSLGYRVRRGLCTLGHALRRCIELLLRTVRVYLHGRAFDHAASISFFALLSALPFLILLVSAIGYLAYVVGPESDAVSGIVAEVSEGLQRFSPVAGDSVRSALQTVIDRRGQFGLFGAGVMLLGASMVFGAIENAVKDVFQVANRRRFLVSRALFSVLLVAGGVVLFMGYYAMTLMDSFLLARVGTTFDAWIRESATLNAILTYVPVPFGFLALLYLPGVARPRWWHGVVGSLLFFFLWEIAREAYAWYVTSLASMDVLYGSMATPVLLILWIFYTANILLFSMSFVAALEKGEVP